MSRISESRAREIAEATELFFRLLIAQFDCLKFHNRNPVADWLLHERISGGVFETLRRHAIGAGDGIAWDEVDEAAKIAYDVHQVVRHRLAWDRNPKGGITVDFDDPLFLSDTGKQGDIRIWRVDGGCYCLWMPPKASISVDMSLKTLDRVRNGRFFDAIRQLYDHGYFRHFAAPEKVCQETENLQREIDRWRRNPRLGAFLKGKRAKREGLPIDVCPYDRDTFAIAWEDGWLGKPFDARRYRTAFPSPRSK